MSDSLIPQDEFSKRLRELRTVPDAVERKGSVDISDIYGNIVSWTILTIRIDGKDTVFMQRMTSEGGERRVLPPEVTELIRRQQSSATTTNRRRGAARGAATRKAAGVQPFVPNPDKAKPEGRRARRAAQEVQ